MDGGRAVVSGAVVAGFLDQVGVVSAAFDDAGVGAVPTLRGAPLGDFSEGFNQCFLPVLRGKSPPAIPCGGGRL